VRDINKFSNNVMARQLYLTLGSLPDATTPGNAEDNLAARSDRATAVIRNWLAQRRLNIPELVMENGSGLSRIERISAAKLGEVLNAAFASSVMPEFMSSLPVAALDGTMRRRLRSDALAGQAHIKTGSLNDVRSIAGYVLSASGQRHAVVCFIQHANAQAGQAAQDALLRWVYELPSEPGANPAAATPPATTTPPARTPARRTERPHAAPAPHRG
jgi:D-alanyl-D-alanine carboxypeptidase/D-alanyl-D-alanine-endopeptidase (penicillin-binding protein 4)